MTVNVLPHPDDEAIRDLGFDLAWPAGFPLPAVGDRFSSSTFSDLIVVERVFMPDDQEVALYVASREASSVL